MAGCRDDMQVWVTRGYSGKEITTTCGSTDQYGGTNLCDECKKKFDKLYPHGWRDVPGDICKHGTYIGDAGGPDILCGECEDGR